MLGHTIRTNVVCCPNICIAHNEDTSLTTSKQNKGE